MDYLYPAIVFWLAGNREGKIFIWELQSSPPVLIAKLVWLAVLHAEENCDFECKPVIIPLQLFQVVSSSIKISNQTNCHVLWWKVTLTWLIYSMHKILRLLIASTINNVQICPLYILQHHSQLLRGWDYLALGCHGKFLKPIYVGWLAWFIQVLIGV